MSNVIVVLLTALAAPQGGSGNSHLPWNECKFQCLIDAIEEFHACLEDGGEFEECLATARESYDACAANCDVTCEEQCFIDSVEMFQGCIDNGGDPIDCFLQSRDFLLDCLDGCGEGDANKSLGRRARSRQGGETESAFGHFHRCRHECRREAYGIFRDCIERGGSEEECLMEAHEAYRACIAECEVSCEEQCFIDGRGFFRDCIEAGGERRECWHESRIMIRECLEGCDG